VKGKSKERKGSSTKVSEVVIGDFFVADVMSMAGFPEESILSLRGLLNSKIEK
jgi:hypothetical protein